MIHYQTRDCFVKSQHSTTATAITAGDFPYFICSTENILIRRHKTPTIKIILLYQNKVLMKLKNDFIIAFNKQYYKSIEMTNSRHC